MSKGQHELKWDGLSTPNWKQPGDAGAGWHLSGHCPVSHRHRSAADRLGRQQRPDALGLSGPETGNWGGDHGNADSPSPRTEKRSILAGTRPRPAKRCWRAISTAGPSGHHTRGGIGNALALAVNSGTVYVVDRMTTASLSSRQRQGPVHHLARTRYGRSAAEGIVRRLHGSRGTIDYSLAGRQGRLYLSSRLAGQIVVFDGATGAVERRLNVPEPVAISLAPGGQLYVVSGGTKVLAFDEDLGEPKTVLKGLTAATSIAVDAAGQMYVGCGDPDNQIKVFAPSGQLVKTIGRAGGRALVGPWTSDGMRFVDGVALDAAGKLWVMENDCIAQARSAFGMSKPAAGPRVVWLDDLWRYRRCDLP